MNARNFMPRDGKMGGKSPYELRFKKGPFPGEVVPLGHLITFLPAKRLSGQLGQLELNGVQGIFIGWKLNNGCAWSIPYYVCPT